MIHDDLQCEIDFFVLLKVLNMSDGGGGGRGGGGIPSYGLYVKVCEVPKGRGLSAILVINRVSILAILVLKRV